MRNLNLKQLEVFCVVANKLSFSSAAKILFMTQPAISKQIHSLEEQCGYRVFEQIGKRIYLTAAGQNLLQAAQILLQAAEAFKSEMFFEQPEISGHLRIGMGDSIQHLIFEPLSHFYNLYPKVDFSIKVSNYAGLSELLVDNKIDFGIMGSPGRPIELVADVIRTFPIEIVASSKNDLAKKNKLTLADLNDQNFVVGDEQSTSYNQTYNLFKEFNIKYKKIICINHFEGVKHAIKANLGVSLVSTFIMRPEIESGKIVKLNVPNLKTKHLPIYWVQHKDKKNTQAIKLFKSFLYQALKKI